MSSAFVSGRYLVCDRIGSGGMSTVHLGRAFGIGGFSRVVAIKRLQTGPGDDASEMATMLLDEARLAARIRHPNVVAALDVVRSDGALLFVMDYVHGPALSWILKQLAARGESVPLPIATRIVLDVLAGLQAAHEAKSERGRALDLVHRDISTHNVLVGEDGLARVADFGIAKANGKLNHTRTGVFRGKIQYMAPEQLRAESVDRRVDVYSTGLVLWELLTLRRLRERDSPAEGELQEILDAPAVPPSRFARVSPELDEVVMKALRVNPNERFQTADEMAEALDGAGRSASVREVADWVRGVAAELLDERSALLSEIEEQSSRFERVEDAAPALALPGPPLTGMPRPVGRRARGVVAALIVIGACALIFVGIRRPKVEPAPPSAVGSEKPPAPSAAMEAPPVLATIAESPSLAAPAAVPTANVAPRHRKGRSARPSSKSCDPPYRIDEFGVRVPRRECFE